MPQTIDPHYSNPDYIQKVYDEVMGSNPDWDGNWDSLDPDDANGFIMEAFVQYGSKDSDRAIEHVEAKWREAHTGQSASPDEDPNDPDNWNATLADIIEILIDSDITHLNAFGAMLSAWQTTEMTSPPLRTPLEFHHLAEAFLRVQAWQKRMAEVNPDLALADLPSPPLPEVFGPDWYTL